MEVGEAKLGETKINFARNRDKVLQEITNLQVETLSNNLLHAQRE